MNDTWDLEITLLTYGFETDKYGVRKPKSNPDRETIMAKEKPVTRNEFYIAGQSNIVVSHLFVIHSFEYDNQTELEYEGQPFKIIKTYPVDFDEIELTCEKKVGA